MAMKWCDAKGITYNDDTGSLRFGLIMSRCSKTSEVVIYSLMPYVGVVVPPKILRPAVPELYVNVYGGMKSISEEAIKGEILVVFGPVWDTCRLLYREGMRNVFSVSLWYGIIAGTLTYRDLGRTSFSDFQMSLLHFSFFKGNKVSLHSDSEWTAEERLFMSRYVNI